jgi:hypothetical protein
MSSLRPAFSARMSSFSAAFTSRAWPLGESDDVEFACDAVNHLPVATLEQDVGYGFSEFAPA